MEIKGLACIICLRSSVIQTANSTIRLLRKFNSSMRCYYVNRYKQLQTVTQPVTPKTVTNPVTNSYKRYKPVPPKTVTNR